MSPGQTHSKTSWWLCFFALFVMYYFFAETLPAGGVPLALAILGILAVTYVLWSLPMPFTSLTRENFRPIGPFLKREKVDEWHRKTTGSIYAASENDVRAESTDPYSSGSEFGVATSGYPIYGPGN